MRIAPLVERRYVSTGNDVFVFKTNDGQHPPMTLSSWVYRGREAASSRVRSRFRGLMGARGDPGVGFPPGYRACSDWREGSGGPRPFGYTADRMHLVEDEAEIVRELFTRVARGESVTGLARKLNQRDIRTTMGNT